jgi:hypothetical protein
MKIAAFALLALLIVGHRAEGDNPPPPELNTILALVNGEPITSMDINLDPKYADDYAALTAAQLPADQFNFKVHDLHQLMVARLIDRRLIVQEFRREGLSYTPADLDTRYAAYLKADLNGDEKKLRDALAYRGETMEEFRTWFEERTIVDWMTAQNVDKKITATSDADKAAQRKGLLAAWLASLRANADIHVTMGGPAEVPPPVEP